MVAETKVKVGGTWRTLTIPEIKVGGSWRTLKSIEVKSGGSWRTVFTGGPTVSPVTTNVSYTRSTSGFCYARLEFNSSGVEYQNANGSSPSMSTSRGNWLDSGLSSQVWVQRVLDIGTLSVDPGSGRLQLSTTRLFGVHINTVGSKSCTATYNFYDAASGGNLIGSAQVTLTANHL